jgi:thiamine biosynthesis lipoprotein
MNWPTFEHEAMATRFSIVIADQPVDYAGQAAAAAWRELDRLEGELSRYVESSDIARANQLSEGETIRIGDDALNCLLLAAEYTIATRHAFDPSYATIRGGATGSPPFTVDPEAHTLTAHAARLHLDLGAIGKGYALDQLAVLLREWEIPRACLQSGGSTVLALEPPDGQPGWPIGLGEEKNYRTLPLVQCALSASGTAVKGLHLVDPTTGAPPTRERRVWSFASTAAASDALSTAFFVMTDGAIAEFCSAHPDVGAAIAKHDGSLTLCGALAGRP